MANKELGEVEVTLRGERHVLCFDMNALEGLCSHLGLETLDELQDIDAKTLTAPRHLKAIFTFALRGGSMPDATPEQVGRLLVMAEIPRFTAALGEAFSAATKALNPREVIDEEDPTIAVEVSPLVS